MIEIDVASGSLCLSVFMVWMHVMGKLKKRLLQSARRQEALYSQLLSCFLSNSYFCLAALLPLPTNHKTI